MALPISAGLKGVLWFILFGAAKCCQYGGLTILGVEGVAWLRKWWKEKRGK
jgi:phosphoglycolate phosphatase